MYRLWVFLSILSFILLVPGAYVIVLLLYVLGSCCMILKNRQLLFFYTTFDVCWPYPIVPEFLYFDYVTFHRSDYVIYRTSAMQCPKHLIRVGNL